MLHVSLLFGDTVSAIWETYCHGEQASDIVSQIEVFISKGLCTIDRSRASAITIEEVASLDHEVGNLVMSLA